jgi:DNA-binding IclR family transcriptional regulator
MTRSYALLKLLEHGPLSRQEIIEITGWTQAQVHSVLQYLVQLEKIAKNKKLWVNTNGVFEKNHIQCG